MIVYGYYSWRWIHRRISDGKIVSRKTYESDCLAYYKQPVKRWYTVNREMPGEAFESWYRRAKITKPKGDVAEEEFKTALRKAFNKGRNYENYEIKKPFVY